MNKLKPCPFCGDESIIVEEVSDTSTTYHTSYWYAYCDRCLAEGPNVYSKERAIKEWNTRHDS